MEPAAFDTDADGHGGGTGYDSDGSWGIVSENNDEVSVSLSWVSATP
jgi:hypothetical protein